jgi:penicillin-binding protein 1A
MRKPQHANKRRSSRTALLSFSVISSAIIGVLAGLGLVYSLDLPQIDDLDHYRPISNTVLYDDQGRPFGSFALQRRVIAQYEDFPKVLYDAVLSIEDKNFEKHSGFDVWRMMVAAYHDVQSRSNVQGASTLTMQLARNLFLSPERTFGRKFRETILAVQIEHHLTKDQIFTLYANQIYLGHGVYGFAAGAQYYFGKDVKVLNLEEAAMLAALPKAPNNYSPIKDPERALRRRNLVIDSMIAAGKISMMEGTAAKKTPIQLQIHDDPNSLAPYFVEEVRRYLERKYGTEQVHEAGLRVYTTLNIDLQKAANSAVLNGLLDYERRHGWRPHLPQLDSTADQYNMTEPSEFIGPDGKARVSLKQKSGVQGALLAIDNASGAVKAMVGGRDFNQSKFNRATQAMRQVGSSFKPYVYTAAIDQGAMPEDEILDVPATFVTASGPYRPHNYDEKFEGLITLKHALAESRNIPALKIAQRLGIKTVIDYTRRFGFGEHIPPYLPVALGAVELTLMEHTSAYSAFPNDGVRALPHYIVKVTDYDGRILEQNYPVVKDVISPRTARTMTSMLREVVLHGTGIAAAGLKYPVAGKTGTTNDFTDAWFIGFSPDITCGVWVGFDEKKTLGNKETGARAALPIWMKFMATALPRLGPGRDFLPVPEPSNRMFAGQTVDSPIREEPAEPRPDVKRDRQPRVLLEPASKREIELPKSVLPGHKQQ